MPIAEQRQLIEQSYRKSLSCLIAEDTYRPKIQNNLEKSLSRLLVNNLQPYKKEEQEKIIKGVVRRLIKEKWISINSDNGQLNYHISHSAFRIRLINHICKHKPTTIKAAEQILRYKAKELGLTENTGYLQTILDYCQREQHLQIEGEKIHYPVLLPDIKQTATALPQTTKTTNQSKTKNIVDIKTDAAILQKADKWLASDSKNRPKTKTALSNIVDSGLKQFALCAAQKDKLYLLLAQKYRFTIDDKGKIKYT
ncbi:MAG: hypothetical protein Q4A74_02305 [Cardiobacteriaceae bacterium]|nr:hypothetical protein [Cardiobacteriaceae bacterium]